jgi:hypothetical protein
MYRLVGVESKDGKDMANIVAPKYQSLHDVNADFILTHHRRFRIDPPGDFLLVRW